VLVQEAAAERLAKAAQSVSILLTSAQMDRQQGQLTQLQQMLHMRRQRQDK
jgi:hypothetical protein